MTLDLDGKTLLVTGGTGRFGGQFGQAHLTRQDSGDVVAERVVPFGTHPGDALVTNLTLWSAVADLAVTLARSTTGPSSA